jgi:hypothetical protein
MICVLKVIFFRFVGIRNEHWIIRKACPTSWIISQKNRLILQETDFHEKKLHMWYKWHQKWLLPSPLKGNHFSEPKIMKTCYFWNMKTINIKEKTNQNNQCRTCMCKIYILILKLHFSIIVFRSYVYTHTHIHTHSIWTTDPNYRDLIVLAVGQDHTSVN